MAQSLGTAMVSRRLDPALTQTQLEGALLMLCYRMGSEARLPPSFIRL